MEQQDRIVEEKGEGGCCTQGVRSEQSESGYRVYNTVL